MCKNILFFAYFCVKYETNAGITILEATVMKREAMRRLLDWQSNDNRKPLILRGARQTGKTWLMKEFGRTAYNDAAYFNFDEENELKSIFEVNKNPQRIVELLGLLRNKKIQEQKTLIIFDEIQECPDALNSLKYFNEKAGEYHVVSAGSLLGTLLAQPKSFPVGQVNLMDIYPMTFDEFLAATDEALYAYYGSIENGQKIENIFHNRLLEAYNLYLIIGGMPECVASWAKNKSAEKIAAIQKELVTVYENDFAKHNGKINSGRLLMVFRSVVSQLAKENRKFIFGCIREGARAREYEEAIEWLVSAGLLNRVYNISKPEHPLPAFDVLNQFKLYMSDTGLLKQMSGTENSAILLNEDFQFKGALTENYVLQQLRGLFPVEPRYLSAKGMEIDFLAQDKADIIPIEVKSGTDKRARSFKSYVEKYSPKKAVRYSKMGYEKNGRIVNIPLYLARKTPELI